uniref:AT-rich interaction domain 3B n=1 Tax=Ictidomys tridecemlineatus TaxID=43179 RepID=A0A287CV26_ICTTR
KKASRLSEEEQRLVQQAFQRNFFSMARQLPMKIKINGRGVLFAQKPVVHLIAGSAPQSIGSSASSSSSSSHCSPSPTSSRGTPSAEPSTSWSL